MGYEAEIAKAGAMVRAFRRERGLFEREEDVLELERGRYEMCWAQVHEEWAKRRDAESEAAIEGLVREIHGLDIGVCEAKVARFKRAVEACERRGGGAQLEKCYEYLQEWMRLYEGYYALVAFRSLEHFAVYMEMEKRESERVWAASLDPYGDGGYTGVSKPFFYFFNRMALRGDIKFISKQMFTGGGKSYSNQYAFAWLLGMDPDNDILDVLGNPTLVLTNTKSVVDIMTNPRFAEVFPEYRKYHETGEDVRDSMFSVCRMKEGELTLAASKKPLNLKVVSKKTSVDGIRVRFLFLDDVCRSCDANNLKQHNWDINEFWNSWWKRNYGTDNFYVVVCGTAYSVNDIMSHLIAYYSKGKMERTKENKYTYRSLDGKSIFIKVPKIDEDFDRSTYPQKFPYEEAIRIKERDYASFMAMEQQRPQNPETTPLAYEKIATYDELPNGLSDYAYACLDPARTGKNYVTMGIKRVRKELDAYGVEIERHYLVDCIFQLRQMADLYGEICDKIEKHHIVKLHVENNTDTSLKFLLDKMLHERGIYFCEISETYSVQNKEEKIRELVYSNEGYFKNQLVYPAMQLFAPSSQMGKFMLYITSYDYYEKMEYDDSIDEECMYIKKFLQKKEQKAKVKLLYL